MWRYEEVLPAGIPATLGEGMTPLIHAHRLGSELGLDRLFIKEEGQNPTCSFKARGLSAAVTMAQTLGADTVALPSAGNAGGAAAAYAAQAGLGCVVAMPSDTPAAIVTKLNAALNEGLQTPEMQKTITNLGSEAKPNSPAEFAAFIAAQHKKWVDVGNAAGVKVN